MEPLRTLLLGKDTRLQERASAIPEPAIVPWITYMLSTLTEAWRTCRRGRPETRSSFFAEAYLNCNGLSNMVGQARAAARHPGPPEPPAADAVVSSSLPSSCSTAARQARIGRWAWRRGARLARACPAGGESLGNRRSIWQRPGQLQLNQWMRCRLTNRSLYGAGVTA
jgi:hypothetical protein